MVHARWLELRRKYIADDTMSLTLYLHTWALSGATATATLYFMTIYQQIIFYQYLNGSICDVRQVYVGHGNKANFAFDFGDD